MPRCQRGSEMPRCQRGSEMPRCQSGSEMPRCQRGSEIIHMEDAYLFTYVIFRRPVVRNSTFCKNFFL
jgi:hypothetical protein